MTQYNKQTWTDGPGGGTPLSAARLNHFEDGIAAAAVLADVADGATPTGAALKAAYGPVSATRPGNRIAALSDSTGRGITSGDSEAGVGSTITINGGSWITWAALLSGGRLVKARNASVTGDTIAMMDARVAADVIAAPNPPSACVVVSGYNDAYASVPVTTYMASLRSIVSKLRAAGIVPILGTPLPTANNAALGGLLALYAVAVRRYAAQQGLALLDFFNWGLDPATGGLLAAVGAGGDGVHPTVAGEKYLGQKVADALTPLLPAYAPPLVSSVLDTANLLPNGLFTGTPSGGLAPSTFVFGSAVTGATPSVTTDAAVVGNLQRITCSGTTAEARYHQPVAFNAAKFAAGDLIAWAGTITASGVTAAVQLEYNVAPFGTKPIQVGVDVTRGTFYTELRNPAGLSLTTNVILSVGPGTGYVEFGQLTAYNLTKLGLDT